MSPTRGKHGARAGPSGAASKSFRLADRKRRAASEVKTKAPRGQKSTSRPRIVTTTSDEESVEVRMRIYQYRRYGVTRKRWFAAKSCGQDVLGGEGQVPVSNGVDGSE
ncbi:hypothetical protein HPB50_021904 [Hyalomma asiaticum]|uniref:Uncharacterized protein n=1 Tax=Hyalomma asiaticum TaxID=266040 RepID=A0ACB7T181_HYAAI|nr:hypothetical protein HPB50_021904 [Hyalomma asiaticum]